MIWRRMVEGLEKMSRPLIWAMQAAVSAFSGYAAFLLHFDFRVPPRPLMHLDLVTRQHVAWQPPAQYLQSRFAEGTYRVILSYRSAGSRRD